MEAYLFDIGNVLVRFDFQKAIRQVVERSSATGEEVAAAVRDLIPELETGRLTSEAFLDEMMRRTAFRGTAQELSDIYCHIFWLHEPMWKLVRQLHGRVPICLFSNTSELHLRHIQETYPEFSLFDLGVFSMRVGAMKPDPAIYREAIAALGVAPERIFYIDDLPANIEAGTRQGLRSFLYDPDDHAALLEALPEPVSH